MNMKNYSLQTCENAIDKYVNELGGYCTQIYEGTLGLGFLILHDAPGYKHILIKEYFINSWNSGHKVTKYKVLPKKYRNLINSI